MVDPCSEDNFILSSVVNSLNIKQYYEPSNIEVIGNNSSPECSHRVNFLVKSPNEQFYMKLSGIVESLTADLPSI